MVCINTCTGIAWFCSALRWIRGRTWAERTEIRSKEETNKWIIQLLRASFIQARKNNCDLSDNNLIFTLSTRAPSLSSSVCASMRIDMISPKINCENITWRKKNQIQIWGIHTNALHENFIIIAVEGRSERQKLSAKSALHFNFPIGLSFVRRVPGAGLLEEKTLASLLRLLNSRIGKVIVFAID